MHMHWYLWLSGADLAEARMKGPPRIGGWQNDLMADYTREHEYE